MRRYWRGFAAEESGQDVVEYGMLVACIALAALVGVQALSQAQQTYFGQMQARVSSVDELSTPGPVPSPTTPPVPTATPVPTSPSAPQSLGAAKATGPKGVDLNWQAPASTGGQPITGYRIYRRLSSDPPGSETLLASTGTVLSYKDTATVKDEFYTYRVAAVNSIGEGPRSAEATSVAK